jgi:hypothetical protein
VSRRRGLLGALGAVLLAAGAAPAGAAEVALAFDDAPGGPATGFRIERRAAGARKFEPLALVGPGVVQFVDRSAGAGQLLCYRVRPLASRSQQDWSTEVCAEAREGTSALAAPAATGAPAEPEASGAAAGGGANADAAAADTAPGATAAGRRVRAGGGWLQVLE